MSHQKIAPAQRRPTPAPAAVAHYFTYRDAIAESLPTTGWDKEIALATGKLAVWDAQKPSLHDGKHIRCGAFVIGIERATRDFMDAETGFSIQRAAPYIGMHLVALAPETVTPGFARESLEQVSACIAHSDIPPETQVGSDTPNRVARAAATVLGLELIPVTVDPEIAGTDPDSQPALVFTTAGELYERHNYQI
ncbi:MAG TPA: hypothetical protein VJ843_02295 [Candidatus Saccharimonadales bacterium]|nr:hypothetical protein [Candidatus Saccharimonadales bacterium]